MSDLQDAIREAHHLVIALWGQEVAANLKQTSRSRNLIDLLGKAAMLLRDAELVAANPKLRQMECIVIKSGIHALYNGGVHRTVCGAVPIFAERIEPRFCVPTCELCVKTLTEEK